MNPFILGFGGLIFGIIFGLLVAWGSVGLVFAMVVIAVLLIGSFLPTSLRAVFGSAILGFLLAWIIAGGLSLL